MRGWLMLGVMGARMPRSEIVPLRTCFTAVGGKHVALVWSSVRWMDGWMDEWNAQGGLSQLWRELNDSVI